MTRTVERRPIAGEALEPLTRRYGDRWKLWPSSEGQYACATVRRGLSWTRTAGQLPVGLGGAYVRTLVTDSVHELQQAIEQENQHIAALLADGTLKADE